METLYVYDPITRFLLGAIDRETKAECEAFFLEYDGFDKGNDATTYDIKADDVIENA